MNQIQSCNVNVLVNNQCQPPELTFCFKSNLPVMLRLEADCLAHFRNLLSLVNLLYYWLSIGLLHAAPPPPFPKWPTVVADEKWGAMWEVGQTAQCQFCSSGGETVDKHRVTCCSWYRLYPPPTPVSTHTHIHTHIWLCTLWCRLAPGGLLLCALELLEALNLN